MNGAMFERYTEAARRALFFARYEASVAGGRAIEVEHLLLGILRDRHPLIAHLVGGHQSADAIRQHLYENVSHGSPIATSIELPLSRDASRALRHASDESDRLLHPHVGLEHLLLGLLHLDRGLAAEALRQHRLALAPVRDALVSHVSANSAPPPEIARMAAALAAIMPDAAARPPRPGPFYLMTTVDGPRPGRRPTATDAGGGGFATMNSIGWTSTADGRPPGRIHVIGPLVTAGITLAQFGLMLEPFVGAPVIVEDEDMGGAFDIELQGEYGDIESLTAALRDQLGLELTRSGG